MKLDQCLGHLLESLHEMVLEMLEDEEEEDMCIANYYNYRDGE